jgi:hypothetical protein
MACESTTDGILASKYLGGHSDLLAGVLVVKTLDDVKSVGCDMQSTFYYSIKHLTCSIAVEGPCLLRKYDGFPRVLASTSFFANFASSDSPPVG